MIEIQQNRDAVKCKCGGEPSVIVQEYCARVYCTECGRIVTRTTRESAVKAWNCWMTRTEKRKRKGEDMTLRGDGDA